jgi:hypothetical protein
MTCGSVSDFYQGSDCIRALLPPIRTCEIYHMLPNIPFFGAAFSRGTPLLSSLLDSIRRRVGCVVPPSGTKKKKKKRELPPLCCGAQLTPHACRGALAGGQRLAHQHQLRAGFSLPPAQ